MDFSEQYGYDESTTLTLCCLLSRNSASLWENVFRVPCREPYTDRLLQFVHKAYLPKPDFPILSIW
jgi:hypothetical protein